MDSEFRELTVRERGLLEKLSTAAIHGREELRTQLAHCRVKQIEMTEHWTCSAKAELQR